MTQLRSHPFKYHFLLGVFFITVQLGCVFGIASKAHSMSGAPYSPECVTTQIGTSAFERSQCDLVGEPYVFPGAVIESIPISYVIPNGTDKLRLKFRLHGYTPDPRACVSDTAPEAGVLLILICDATYPDLRAYLTPVSTVPLNWFGPMFGANSTGWVVGEAVDTAVERWGKRIDLNAGISISGTSQGGTGGILLSILMEGWWRAFITVVDANSAHTMFVKNPTGQYWRDPNVRLAWQDFDIRRASIHWHFALGGADNIYYRIKGGSNDTLGFVDQEFFRLCDKYKVACFGTWDLGGHNADGEAGINLPRGLFNAGQEPYRLDTVLPVFSHSTANHWGSRGHYNLSLSSGKGSVMQDGLHITVPIRYRRLTNLGADIPDQPTSATFTLTLRRLAAPVRVGDRFQWRLGAQSGETTATKAGEITIEALTLASSEQYTSLIVEPVQDEWAIVYTRQERVKEEWANFQRFYDVKNVNTFTETTLVLDSLTGKQRIIHSCEYIKKVCSPHDGRVSPDGKRIVYTVARAGYMLPVKPLFINLLTDPIEFQATSYELWIHDIAENTNKMIGEGRMPDWCGNDCLVFASDRAGTYAPLAHHGNEYPHKALQIYRGRLI